VREALSILLQVLLLPIAHASAAPAQHGNTVATAPNDLLGSNSPYMATTAGQFAEDCKSDEGACVAIIGNVLMDKIQYSPTSHICLPRVNYANPVPAWIAAHHNVASMSVSDGVFVALQTLYKCGAPNNY
jgi:hypothetical protein